MEITEICVLSTVHCEKTRKFAAMQIFFRQINFELSYVFRKKLLSRNFCEKMVAVKSRNFHNVLSHFFGKNFVKVTDFLKKILNSWFDEIFLLVKVSYGSTVCAHCGKTRKFLSPKLFSWNQLFSNFFIFYLVKPLLSRSFCVKCVQIWENFRN